MKIKLNLQTFLIAAAVAIAAYFLLRKPTSSTHSPKVKRTLFAQKYRLTPGAQDNLKCKYRISGTGHPPGTTVAELINERMDQLQSNAIDLENLLARGHDNGWDAYETIYHEATSNLLREGVLYPDGSLCSVNGGSVSVSTATP